VNAPQQPMKCWSRRYPEGAKLVFQHIQHVYIHLYEAVLGVWLPAPLPTPRALPDHGALRPLAVGVEIDLGGIDV